MAGRPKNFKPTVSKTYAFYAEDITEMITTGKSPKEIFRMGLHAIRKGWSPHSEGHQVKALQDRISNMSLVLNDYVRKFEKLCMVVENGLNIKLQDKDFTDMKELEAKIDKVYYEDVEQDKKSSVNGS